MTTFNSKPKLRIENNAIHLGGHCTVRLMRTLRIPDDGNNYPLPPGLDTFPLKRVEDYLDRVPESWKEHGGVFFPMYQREAMWLSFSGHSWHPAALKVAVGKVNALTGESWREKLQAKGNGKSKKEQDYLVVPNQPWLDGINSGVGTIKQFVAMPLGMGYTVEGQVTGEETFGGIQLVAFEALEGKFPDEAPKLITTDWVQRGGGQKLYSLSYGAPIASYNSSCDLMGSKSGLSASALGALNQVSRRRAGAVADMMEIEAAPLGGASEMGLGAGGSMVQKIYPDPYGIDTWDQKAKSRVYIHIVNSAMYEQITGEKPPASPVSAATYTQHGYPWFDLYDEHKGDLAPSETLQGVKSIKAMDKEKGFGIQQDDSSIEVDKKQVKVLSPDPDPHAITDGNW